MKLEINKHTKVTELIFEENSFAQNGVNRAFWDPRSIFLSFSLNLFIRLFFKLYLMAGIEKWVKKTVLDF